MPDDFAVQSLLLTLAAPAWIEAIKATGWRQYVFWAVTVVLGGAGLGWVWLKQIYPPLSESVGQLAVSPQSWLMAAVLILIVVAATGGKTRMGKPENDAGAPRASLSASAIQLPEWLPDVPGRLDALSEKLDALARAAISQGERQSAILQELDGAVRQLASRADAVEATLRPKNRRLVERSRWATVRYTA